MNDNKEEGIIAHSHTADQTSDRCTTNMSQQSPVDLTMEQHVPLSDSVAKDMSFKQVQPTVHTVKASDALVTESKERKDDINCSKEYKMFPVACGICSNKFEGFSALQRHLETHKNDLDLDDVLSLKFSKSDGSRMSDDKSTERKKQEYLICGSCSQVFKTATLLHQHYKEKEMIFSYSVDLKTNVARPTPHACSGTLANPHSAGISVDPVVKLERMDIEGSHGILQSSHIMKDESESDIESPVDDSFERDLDSLDATVDQTSQSTESIDNSGKVKQETSPKNMYLGFQTYPVKADMLRSRIVEIRRIVHRKAYCHSCGFLIAFETFKKHCDEHKSGAWLKKRKKSKLLECNVCERVMLENKFDSHVCWVEATQILKKGKPRDKDELTKMILREIQVADSRNMDVSTRVGLVVEVKQNSSTSTNQKAVTKTDTKVKTVPNKRKKGRPQRKVVEVEDEKIDINEDVDDSPVKRKKLCSRPKASVKKKVKGDVDDLDYADDDYDDDTDDYEVEEVEEEEEEMQTLPPIIQAVIDPALKSRMLEIRKIVHRKLYCKTCGFLVNIEHNTKHVEDHLSGAWYTRNKGEELLKCSLCKRVMKGRNFEGHICHIEAVQILKKCKPKSRMALSILMEKALKYADKRSEKIGSRMAKLMFIQQTYGDLPIQHIVVGPQEDEATNDEDMSDVDIPMNEQLPTMKTKYEHYEEIARQIQANNKEEEKLAKLDEEDNEMEGGKEEKEELSKTDESLGDDVNAEGMGEDADCALPNLDIMSLEQLDQFKKYVSKYRMCPICRIIIKIEKLPRHIDLHRTPQGKKIFGPHKLATCKLCTRTMMKSFLPKHICRVAETMALSNWTRFTQMRKAERRKFTKHNEVVCEICGMNMKGNKLKVCGKKNLCFIFHLLQHIPYQSITVK